MGYWWQNLLQRQFMKGKPIIKVVGEGCQSMNSIEWVGKITGFEKNERNNCDNIVIEVVLHNNSYGDSRDRERTGAKKEIYTYPLVNADIQDVNGVWVLYT